MVTMDYGKQWVILKKMALTLLLIVASSSPFGKVIL
jgi:hypothetical protein